MIRSQRKIASAAGSDNRHFAYGLLRAFGGAILFSFPMLMTMEMWWLGFALDRLRLALLIIVDIPLLVGLSHFAGFEETFDFLEDLLDALTAYAVGAIAAAVPLMLFAVIGPGMSAGEIIGKIAVQAVPAGIGAMLARSQFGERQPHEESRLRGRYDGVLFLMAAGSIFLCSSLAATEEVVLISYMMSSAHAVALFAFSLAVMHAFTYVVMRGKCKDGKALGGWTLFSRFTVVGYALALLISLAMLWLFGHTDGLAARHVVQAAVVLGFPASLGAGAARLFFNREDSMSKQKGGEKAVHIPAWSWATAAVGLLLVAGSAGFLLYEHFAGDRSPPALSIETTAVAANGDGYLVEIQVSNRGGSPAAALGIEGTIKKGKTTVETSTVTIDYVPSSSKRKAGLIFSHDPRTFELELRATGYADP